MRKHAAGILLALAALGLATPALAQPKVSVEITAEKDMVVEVDGKKQVKRVPASVTQAGDTLHYTISYRNSGSSDATAANIDNPVPEGTSYIADSARGPGDVSFSIDNGKSYKKPSLLSYEVSDATGKKQTVKASPEAYTNIRWVLERIPAGATGQVTYSVRVK